MHEATSVVRRNEHSDIRHMFEDDLASLVAATESDSRPITAVRHIDLKAMRQISVLVSVGDVGLLEIALHDNVVKNHT